MQYIISFFLVIIPLLASAQEGSMLCKLTPSFNGQALELDKAYFLASIQDSIKITKLQCYITGIRGVYEGKEVYNNESEHHLIDLRAPNSLQIWLPKCTALNHIEFKIGVDSLLSMDGAHGGDLDPVHGMYWAWQSGYINFKLEGSSPSCPTRKNEFQFHVGGFRAPNNAQRTIRLAINTIDSFTIDLPIDKLLSSIDLTKTPNVMSPGAKAMQIADLFPQLIQILELR